MKLEYEDTRFFENAVNPTFGRIMIHKLNLQSLFDSQHEMLIV